MGQKTENNIKELYIGIGSNLDNPILQVSNAIEALTKLDEFNDIKISNFYESPPMGPSNQNNYVNCAAMFRSSESPEDILLLLKDIEVSMGRKKSSIRWFERIIDLDIILYGDLLYKSGSLTIPHKNASERAFVLKPMIDINPNVFIPEQGYAKDLLKNCLYNDINLIKNDE